MTSNGLSYLERVLARTTHTMSGIGAIAVLLMMVLNIVDISARAFLRSTIRGTHELVEIMMVLVVFLGIPYVQYKKTNISVGLLVDKFPQRIQSVTNGLICILGLCMIGIMTWEGFGYFARLWETGKKTEVLSLPVAPLQFILAGGLFVLCVVLISQLLHAFFKEV